MANETRLNMQLLLRRDQEFVGTYKLEAGEPGFEIGSNKLKIGDGVKTWAELPIANEAQIVELINSAISAHAAGYYTKDEVDGFIQTLTQAVGLKLDASVYNEYIATHSMTDEAITGAINGVDAKFGSYRTSALQDEVDNGIKGRLDALEANFGDGEGTVEAQIEAAVKAEEERAIGIEGGLRTDVDAIKGDYLKGEHKTALEGLISSEQQRAEGIEGGLRTDVNSVTERMGTAEGKITVLENGKADKSFVETMYTNGQIDTAVQGAKDYAKGLVDAIPAQTDYTVSCADADHEAAEGVPAFKRHTLTQNGQTICTIDIPKELVVEAGYVRAVIVEGEPYEGAEVGDKYIELVIANQTEPIYVPAKDLVDIYTAEKNATEVQVVISNTNEVSATLVNGGVTEAKLAADVHTKLNKVWEEVGVAEDLVDALEQGQVKANKEAIEAINDEEDGILAQAEGYTDSQLENYYTKGDLSTALISVNYYNEKVDDDDIPVMEFATKGGTEHRVAFTGEDGISVTTDGIGFVVSGADLSTRILAIEENEAGYTTTDEVESAINEFEESVVAPIADRVTALEDADFTTKISTAKQEAIDAASKDAADKAAVVLSEAQAYADQAEADALQAAKDYADGKFSAVDTGVMQIVAGKDIIVSPESGTGVVTVAHETFTTGTYARTPESSDVTNDVYMMTAVSVDNGHVTGANVQSLAHALMGMTFIFDGGTSGAENQ